MELDVATIRAGVAALQGRGPGALAAYREALKGWRQAGLAFDEALAVTDMASLLPPNERASAEVEASVEWARETLEQLGATPILERLSMVKSEASMAQDALPVPASRRDEAARTLT